MPEPRTESRPSQVTILAGLAILASFLMIVVAYDVLGQVESVDTRHQIEDYLGTGGGSGLTITVDRMIETMRIATMAGGALAAAALVLAIYVLRRHNGARIGLTVVSLMLLPTAFVVKGIGLLPVTLAGAALMLWSPAVRQWFGTSDGSLRSSTTVGRVDDPRMTPPPNDNGPAAEPAVEPAGSAPPPPPPAESPYGQAPPPYAPPPAPPSPYPGAPAYPSSGAYPPPGAYQPPAAYPPPGAYGPGGFQPASPGRPGAVVAAAVITWISAGMTLLGGLLMLLEVLFMRSAFVAQVESTQGLSGQYSPETIVTAVEWIGVVLVLWSLLAVVAAVFVFRGANWARVVLAMCASLAALVSLVSILAIIPVVTLAAAVTTLVLLFRPASNRFFSPGGGSRAPQVW